MSEFAVSASLRRIALGLKVECISEGVTETHHAEHAKHDKDSGYEAGK